MTENSIPLIVALGLFLLGLAIGALVQRNTKGDNKKIARLQQKLTESEDRYTRYQADVTSHFMDTARKVQSLNKSYRDVNNQLAAGARKLCEDSDMEEFLSLNFEHPSEASLRGHAIALTDEGVAPPMDYAPKDKPEEEGTLSESYGFEEPQLKEFDEQLETQYKNDKA